MGRAEPTSKIFSLLVIRRMIYTASQGRPMTNAQEKRVKSIAERKGFRLDKAGHGKGHGRFYIMNLAEGGRMRFRRS